MIGVWCLQQVHRVLKRLATGPGFRGQKVRKITVTGHSLGGALAVLAGCDISEWISINRNATGSWHCSQEAIGEDTVDPGSRGTDANSGGKSTRAGSSSSSSSRTPQSSSSGVDSSSQQQQQGQWQWFPNLPGDKWASTTVGVITFGAPRVGVRFSGSQDTQKSLKAALLG